MKALFIGFCTIDTIEDKEYLGGAAGGSALTAAALGVTASIVTVLSQDERGQRYRAALEKASIDTSLSIHTSPSIPTCKIIDPQGAGSTRKWQDNGCLAVLEQVTFPQKSSNNFDAVFLCSGRPSFISYVENNTDAAPKIFIPGTYILQDSTKAYQSLLPKVNLLFLNEEESTILHPSYALAQGTKIVITTLGADGCIVYTSDGDKVAFAAPQAPVVDTTGAGDSFALGFSLSYLEKHDIPSAVAAGNDLASKVIQKYGATLLNYE